MLCLRLLFVLCLLPVLLEGLQPVNLASLTREKRQQQNSQPFPIEEVLVVLRGDSTVQLNVGGVLDGVAQEADDVINLRGSTDVRLAASDSLVYVDNTIRIRRGSALRTSFGPVAELNVQERVLVGGASGRLEALQFRGTSPLFFTGPGLLYVNGTNGANETAATFTDSPELSQRIPREVRSAQVMFNSDPVAKTAVATSPLVSGPVIELTRASRNAISSGTQVVFSNGNVMVLNAQGTVVATFGSIPNKRLTTFFANSLDSVTTGTATYNVPPPGGVTIYVNQADGKCFAYLSSDQLLEAAITNAIANAGGPNGVTPLVNLNFVPMGGPGQGMFVFNEIRQLESDQQTVSVSMEAQINLQNSFVLVRTQNEEIVQAYPAKSLFAVVRTGGNVVLNELDGWNAGRRLRAGGTLRIDTELNAALIADPVTDQYITDTLDAFPDFVVQVVGESEGDSLRITLQSEGTLLLDGLERARKVTVRVGEKLVYFNDSVGSVNATPVADSAQVEYCPDLSLVRVLDSAGETVLQQGLGGPFFTRLLTVHTLTVSKIDPTIGNVTYRGGGTLYSGQSGAVYLPFSQIDSSAVEALIETESLVPIAEDIQQLNFFRDGTIDFYVTSSPINIPGNGRLYLSMNRGFYTTDQQLIQEIPARVSQLLPIDLDREMEEVVISRDGSELYRFDPASSSTFDLAGGSVLTYGEGRLEVPTAFAGVRENITSLVTYDGCDLSTFNSSSDVALSPAAGDCLVVDTGGGSAFFTSDQLSGDIIKHFLGNLMATFVGPSIPQTPPPQLRSKLFRVEAGFGQFLTVYEGARVKLRCDAGNANPPASLSFLVNTNATSLDYLPLAESEDVMVEVGGDNQATLCLTVSVGVFEYRCQASNVVGADSGDTRVIVLPRENPSIESDFLPGAVAPGEVVVSVSSVDSPVRTVSPVVGPLPSSSIFVPVTGISIGCKAGGRPRPGISWFRSSGGGGGEGLELINATDLGFNVTSNRPGQSVLEVEVGGEDTTCTLYVCVADSGGTPAEGMVQVCPQRVRLVEFQYQRFFNGSETTVGADQLPEGVVEPNAELCFGDLPTCPVVEFEYVVGEFSDCTQFCDSGQQTREVTCHQVQDGVRGEGVGEGNCTEFGLTRPEEVMSCNDRPCPSYFLTGKLGPCSQTCRGGTQEREVVCVMPVRDQASGRYVFNVNQTVELEVCANFSTQAPPVGVIPCNQGVPCPVRYQTSQYGECDQFSCQQRSLSCVTFNPWYPSDTWPTNLSVCEAQGLPVPALVRSCGGGVCSFGAWTILSAEECSVPCGFGLQAREVACLNTTAAADQAVIQDGFCNPSLRPDNPAMCFERNCPGVCEMEPAVCPTLRRLRLCKSSSFSSLTQDCCKSCPLQATPIPPL